MIFKDLQQVLMFFGEGGFENVFNLEEWTSKFRSFQIESILLLWESK